jgi:hypothetical protein
MPLFANNCQFFFFHFKNRTGHVLSDKTDPEKVHSSRSTSLWISMTNLNSVQLYIVWLELQGILYSIQTKPQEPD